MKTLLNRKHKITVANAHRLSKIQNRISTITDIELRLFNTTILSSQVFFERPHAIDFHIKQSPASEILNDKASLMPTEIRFTLMEIELRMCFNNCEQLSSTRFKESWRRVFIKNHTWFDSLSLNFWRGKFNILRIDKDAVVITKRKHNPKNWFGEWTEFCKTKLIFKVF
jgi:hypothetical protein